VLATRAGIALTALVLAAGGIVFLTRKLPGTRAGPALSKAATTAAGRPDPQELGPGPAQGVEIILDSPQASSSGK